MMISSPHPSNTRSSSSNFDRMLTPSQVPSLRKKPQNRKQRQTQTQTQHRAAAASHNDCFGGNGKASSSLVPSQIKGGRSNHNRVSSTTKIAATAGDRSNNSETAYKKSEKPESPTNNRDDPSGSSSINNNTNNRNSNSRNANPNNRTTIRSRSGNGGGPAAAARRRDRPRSSGNFPDVLWRHIPLEHIRRHPCFVPLPDPQSIHHLQKMEDVRNFRQESWQWDVLHEGRMTTSQAVAALGFLEPTVGDILGVPKGLRRGGVGAYHRLRRPATTRTLREMNDGLCENNEDSDNNNDENDDQDGSYWTQPPGFPFAAKYMVPITEDDHRIRKNIANKYANSEENRWSIRMVWGNVQESTSLLTALNYFWKRDNKVLMKEIGMCGAGLQLNTTSSQGLILGATPDAILCHPDGRIEAVEVKNHCPFVPNNNHNNHSNRYTNNNRKPNNHAFRMSKLGLSKTDSIMCQYLPQLMMEMLCLGESCESAIMVRQTATHGSLVLRVPRNNEWIDEMVYWLHRFCNDYVETETPPPKNFFFESQDPSDRARYQQFLELTKQIEQSVELLEHVPHRSVQRAFGKNNVPMDLFLD